METESEFFDPTQADWPIWRQEHLLVLHRAYHRGELQSLRYYKRLLDDAAASPPGGDLQWARLAQKILCRQPLRGA